MTASDLVKRARELLVGVTEGPWHCIQSPRSCEFTSSVWAPNDHCIAHVAEHMDQNVSREHADAAFIAASRTLVPELLEALEAAEAERDAMQVALMAAEHALSDVGDSEGIPRTGWNDGEGKSIMRYKWYETRAQSALPVVRKALGMPCFEEGPDNADG